MEKEIKTVSSIVVKRIKQILKEKNMSIYRLEKITAIPHSTMQTLMRADNNSVNLKTVLLICRGLGVSAEYFFASNLFEDEDLDIDWDIMKFFADSLFMNLRKLKIKKSQNFCGFFIHN